MKSEAMNQFVADVMSGRHNRRDLFRRAAALGISATVAGGLINRAAAQDATPSALTGDLEVFSW